MPVLQVQNLSKKYSSVQALQNFSLQAEKGEIFGLIGLNGAGKSTLIKILMNLARADEGSASLHDLPPSDLNSRKGVGYLPEVLSLPRNLTPLEFLHFSGRLSRNGKSLHRLTQEVLKRVNLPEEAWKRPLFTLSKGQQQRVGLANALLSAQDLFILDEPASGLDPLGRKDVKNLLLSLRQEGKTIFFTSHILGEVEEICDRVCIIHFGQNLFQGTVTELYQATGKSSLEDAFLGILSAFPGVIQRM